MVDLAEVRRGERVLDPACGSGSFLAAAWGRGAEIDGFEIDPELVGLCQLNLALLGANPRSVRRADLFRETAEDRWDVVLANPPFSVDIADPDVLRGYGLARGKPRVSSDVLFLEAAWRLLRPGGRMAVVLPHSVLANPRFEPLRAWMSERFVRRAIVSLPEGCSDLRRRPSRAAILVLPSVAPPSCAPGWRRGS
ncbi:MAG: N-6 DNA methylase [Planctomycetes bacterium]|nr:N-6 DNA methylase [Planctomycetota bacterium]